MTAVLNNRTHTQIEQKDKEKWTKRTGGDGLRWVVPFCDRTEELAESNKAGTGL